MSRVIPGVAVKVVKDVVVPQLSPAGVLGLVGIVERITPEGARVARASTWKELVACFGPGTAHSMPEARQALENGVTEVVVVPVDSSGAAPATVALPGVAGGTALALQARAAGSWANGLRALVTHRTRGGAVIGFDLELLRPNEKPGEGEALRNLHILPGAARSAWDLIGAQSSRVGVDAAAGPALAGVSVSDLELTPLGAPVASAGGQDLIVVAPEGGARVRLGFTQQPASEVFNLELLVYDDAADTWTDGLGQGATRSFDLSDPTSFGALAATLDALPSVVVRLPFWPREGESALGGGADASVDAYINALGALEDEGDVDLVIAARQDLGELRRVRELASAVMAHCQNAADGCNGRLGFVQVGPTADTPAGAAAAVEQARDLATTLNSDRMVVVAPHGLLGAVAGRVGNLDYFESPTFKGLAGVGDPAVRLGQTHQKALIQGRVLAVAKERGRGVMMVKGITTDDEQISVRRVADRAVRGVKLVGDLFIGRLNNEDGRAALKQKLSELLLQMQKDGAIVPSTDGSQPSFVVDVYSSQDDFSKGIVRVDLAVRPVRAIDYIEATLRIQA